MFAEIPLWLSVAFMLAGFAVLAWSSDVFVDGAASLARIFGVSPFIIGMVVVGFGTSAPELCVSVMSGVAGHANVSVGNAHGSCVFNIAVIVGVAAMIRPLRVRPGIVFESVPVLLGTVAVSYFVLRDGTCSRPGAVVLLAAFALVMTLYCLAERRRGASGGGSSSGGEPQSAAIAFAKVAAGLVLLVGSSHLLVWGAVDFARSVGVSDLVVGLTVVAAGTSLPELASAVAAARRGEPELVLGNIIGSNVFNMLAVVGIAAGISPVSGMSPYVVGRDLPAVAAMTLAVAVFGMNWRSPSKPGVITRVEGAAWLFLFAAYVAVLIVQEVMRNG